MRVCGEEFTPISLGRLSCIRRAQLIAEGVEIEEQMSFLRVRQCDEIQGYYFSKPLLAKELADKLRVNGLAPRKRTTVGSFGASL